ncbi:MFS transporter [Glycomyces buryatensis]|uniref:MFS transporter n=1 Tax=Glycomyces buryatensis TaxID=2570927 RepID=A0A4S8QEK1_9ACTN|nr:MFS transporter [Glycomyces buryatensis]THV43057.1 MFS transporter [Glycomyces buryatensis]
MSTLEHRTNTSGASATPASIAVETAPERATLKQWLAVAAVSLGVFVVMTSELMPVGLLTPISADLGVSAGTAGLMVTVPGLVAAVTAPLSVVLFGRVDRRLVLLALALLVAAANCGAAMVDSFEPMLAARVLVGLSIGAFWSVAGGIALRLVPARDVPRATAVVYGGIGAATVLGVPAGTYLGDLFGWRAALVVLGGLALLALAAIAVLVPKLPPTQAVSFSALPKLVRGNKGVRTGLALTFLIVSGHFIAYTFISPILQSKGIGESQVGGLLLAFGAAALVATFASGSLIGKHLRPTLIGLATAMVLAMAAMAFLVGDAFSAGAVLVLWGIGYGLVSPAVQTWYLNAAPGEAEIATSLNTMMFNLSIAFGSFAGGLVVDAGDPSGVLWIGALLLIPVALLVAGRRGRTVAATATA